MKQYLNSEQTAKLIELGFKKTDVSVDTMISTLNGLQQGTLTIKAAFSIGELIEILPPYIDDEDDEDNVFELSIFLGTKWTVTYGGIFDIKVGVTQTELIDALYDMVVKLKEEGVI